MEFVWVDLQHQPQGTDVWVSFEGSGLLQCYLIPSPQFSAFAKGDAVDCFQFDVAPPEHVVQIPREGLWHVVMRGGVGAAEVRVSPSARLDANLRAILQPEKYQDPTPDPGALHLTEALLAGPTDWLAGLQHATDQAVMDQMAKIDGIQRQLDDTVAAAYTGGPGGAGFDATNAKVNQLRGELITALDALGIIPDYSSIDPKSVNVDPDGLFTFNRTEKGIPVQVYGEFKNGTGTFFDQTNSTYYTFANGKLANTRTLDAGRAITDDALLFNTITALVGAPAAFALVKAGGAGAFRGLQALLSREGADRVTGITGKTVFTESLAAAERRAADAAKAEAAALRAQAEKAAAEAAKAAAAEGGPLANVSKAVIDARKFEGYSMDAANPKNNGKWQAWVRIGFQVDTEAARAAATQQVLPQIRAQLPNRPARLVSKTPHGERFEVDSIINGPSGRGTLKMIYQIEDGIPRLITNWLEVHK